MNASTPSPDARPMLAAHNKPGKQPQRLSQIRTPEHRCAGCLSHTIKELDSAGQETILLPILDAVEVRVLGSLLEKSISTPEYYPLSLNALVNACNQKSNRDPVMVLDEEDVRNAGGSLGNKGMVAFLRDVRATKYEHRLSEVLNLGRREEAILCELLLRGPQTPGELRGRTERLHRMEEITDVQSALQKLMDRDSALVAVVPRQPGTKEIRYGHLLSGTPVMPSASEATLMSGPDWKVRVATLEEQLGTLQQKVTSLEAKLEQLLTQLS